MALSLQGGEGRGRRRIRRRQTLSEINVTPLVDVMLVLLIIFMISAPLLTAGVELELPKTEASAITSEDEPLTVSVKRDGSIYIQETQTSYEELAPRLTAIAGEAIDKPIFVRGDGGASFESVARVMAKLSTSGFTKISLITDTVGDKAPAVEAAAPAAAG